MLCDRAGVNRSTFYYYLDSIQFLIHWIYHEEVNEPVLRLKTADEFTDFMFRDTRENWRLLIAALLSDQGRSMEDLSPEKQLELEYIAEYYCADHFHVTLLWMRQGMEPSP